MDTHLPITPPGPMPTDVGRNPVETKAASVQRVLSVRHWTDRLFSFTCTRDPGLRFHSGQFVMIGLEVAGKPLLRAYSIASAHYEDALEFLSIKVPDGPLTSRLQHMQVGDAMLVGRKPVGTLVTSFLLPGRNLYLVGSGTGLAPFMSLIQDPDVYDLYDHVVLVHGVRLVSELAYADKIGIEIPANEFYGEIARGKLLYYPTVTREPFRNQGRSTDLIASGKLAVDLGLPPIDPAAGDRVMICGSPEMLADLQTILKDRGFVEGNSNHAGTYVVEKAFSER